MFYIALAKSVFLIAISALLSCAETAVMLLSPGRVHRLLEAERRGASALDRLAEHRHRLRAVSTLVSGLCYAVTAFAAVQWASGVIASASTFEVYTVELLAATVAVLAVYALAQALPRTLAATNPERLALDAAPLALPIMLVVYPVAAVLGAPWKWLVEVVGAERTFTPWAVTAEWRGTSSDDDAEREEAEEALLEAVSDFAEKIAREVMVPRTDMKSLPDTATSAEAITLIEATGYSRVPVFHETIDDVRGVLYAKDLLVSIGGGCADVDIAAIARKPYFVPETKPVEELMVEMRERTHIAIVADEYGGTAGLITLEDLLEEIVGDISDEYDSEEPLLVDLGEGRYQVDARLPVNELNELFDTGIETEADSVGGLFTEVAGRIPDVGDHVVFEGLRLTVTELQGTRICRLIVEPAGGTEQGDTDA